MRREASSSPAQRSKAESVPLTLGWLSIRRGSACVCTGRAGRAAGTREYGCHGTVGRQGWGHAAICGVLSSILGVLKRKAAASQQCFCSASAALADNDFWVVRFSLGHGARTRWCWAHHLTAVPEAQVAIASECDPMIPINFRSRTLVTKLLLGLRYIEMGSSGRVVAAQTCGIPNKDAFGFRRCASRPRRPIDGFAAGLTRPAC